MESNYGEDKQTVRGRQTQTTKENGPDTRTGGCFIIIIFHWFQFFFSYFYLLFFFLSLSLALQSSHLTFKLNFCEYIGMYFDLSSTSSHEFKLQIPSSDSAVFVFSFGLPSPYSWIRFLFFIHLFIIPLWTSPLLQDMSAITSLLYKNILRCYDFVLHLLPFAR